MAKIGEIIQIRTWGKCGNLSVLLTGLKRSEIDKATPSRSVQNQTNSSPIIIRQFRASYSSAFIYFFLALIRWEIRRSFDETFGENRLYCSVKVCVVGGENPRQIREKTTDKFTGIEAISAENSNGKQCILRSFVPIT